jgi:hypothetical protein
MKTRSFLDGEGFGLTQARERGDARRGTFTHRSAVLSIAAILLMVSLVVSVGRESPRATPVFAQAYGFNCTVCHTQMPMLNAFGRYVQRTGYAALDYKTLRHSLPVFDFDLGSGYTAQSGQPASAYRVNGPGHTNVVQANGAFGPDLTYKVEQLVDAGGQAGFLDQTWVAYHNILDRHGHLFVGKLAQINLDEYAADVLAEVNDAGQGHLPNVAVGVHNYALDYSTGRWGAKFNYVGGKTLVQVAYLGNATGGSSFGDAYDFSRASDKTFQWRVAYADPAKPWEIGVFGESGALGISGSSLLPGRVQVDNYNVITPYINKDPRPGSPGFRFEYATATDANPGYLPPATGTGALQPAGSTRSSWMVGSAYQMVLHDHGMVNVTYYHTNQALAETGFTGLVQPTGPATGVGPGFSYALDPFVRIYTSMYVAQGQRPAYSITMWITPPLWSRLK